VVTVRTDSVERRPARLSGALGVGAALLAVLATAAYSTTAGLAGLAGLLVLLTGVVAGVRRGVTLGAVVLLVGVLYAGLAGMPAAVLLVGVGATVLAWDLGGFAIDLGAQLGREANTRRVEAVHATASAAVAAAAAGVGYGVYLVATAGQPTLALLLLLLAGVLLAATLEYS